MRTIRTKGLPGGISAETIYTFFLKDPSPQVILEIPGDWAGPDNCRPTFPEQEHWLNTLNLGMRQSWDCQWTFEDEEAVGRLLSLLAPFMEGPAA